MAELVEIEWPAPPTVRALFSTRNGGVSQGAYAGQAGSGGLNLSNDCGDDPMAVAANRARLAARGVPPVYWLRQVHGSAVVQAPPGLAHSQAGPDTRPNADACVARAAGVACAVLVADCLPVLLCNDSGTVVAAAHAGWRGLCAGVLENTVAAMQVEAGTLMAILGVAIGPERFEVGPDVRDAFMAVDARASEAFLALDSGKFLANLYWLARQRLARAGVTRVYGGGGCTLSDADRFYSYRRERTTGRMAGMIWIARD